MNSIQQHTVIKLAKKNPKDSLIMRKRAGDTPSNLRKNHKAVKILQQRAIVSLVSMHVNKARHNANFCGGGENGLLHQRSRANGYCAK